MNQFPRSIWVYHYGLFGFFWKFAEIFAAQGALPVSTTLVTNWKKSSSRKILHPDIVPFICPRYRWHRWQICHQCQQHKVNWWKNSPPVSFILMANLPLVSLILAAICHRCHWHRWKICYRCQSAPWVANISANFRKNSKWPYCYFQGLGGRWFMKNPEAKNS